MVYKNISRDVISKSNKYHGLQVPVYSTAPPVSQKGQLYFNSNTQCLN